MWDPVRYVDTDFGLTGGESFEPNDGDEERDISLHQPHIMTVLGPISPEDLGVCQHAEHILAGPGTRNDVPAIRVAADELEAYFTVGGRSMVDITVGGSARNPDGLRTLAQLVPVHIVAATSVLAPVAQGAGRSLDNALQEIRHGIGDTGIRPGIVVTVSTTNLEANCDVSRQTGLPHFVLAGDDLDPGAMLSAPDVDEFRPERLIAGGLDADTGTATARTVFDRGWWLSFDRVGHDSPETDRRLAGLIAQLVAAGFGHRILLSQRLAGPGNFVSRGGSPGWIHVMERFVLDLMSAGLTGDQVRSILIDNPAQALAIVPPDGDGGG